MEVFFMEIILRGLTRPSTSSWTRRMREYSARVRGLSRLRSFNICIFGIKIYFQVVLGLHIVRGDNICVVGEIDEDIDQRLDLHNIKADPLNAVPHGAH